MSTVRTDLHIMGTLASCDEMYTESASTSAPSDEWVALVSGLEVGSTNPSDGQIQMLAEYLTAEISSPEEQSQAARISRLIIAGNSLGAPTGNTDVVNGDSERKSVCTLPSYSHLLIAQLRF